MKMAEGGNEKDDGMELAENLGVNGENNQEVLNSEEKFCFSLMVTSEQRDSIVELFDQNEWPIEENSQNDVPMDVDPDRFRIPHDDQCDECMYCYCKPCITSENNRQMWWEDECHPARRINHSLRKESYKKFWTMLFHRGVFLDERYQSIKQAALKRDPRCKNMVWHRRDILPKCVLELVRMWFPNPPNMPYMGHMWE